MTTLEIGQNLGATIITTTFVIGIACVIIAAIKN
jgi:Ca2+/Na+ antiporter